MKLDDAVKNFLDKDLSIDMLFLLVHKDFKSKRIQKTKLKLFNSIDSDEEEDKEIEYIETSYGILEIRRSEVIENIILIDKTQSVTIRGDQVTYK